MNRCTGRARPVSGPGRCSGRGIRSATSPNSCRPGIGLKYPTPLGFTAQVPIPSMIGTAIQLLATSSITGSWPRYACRHPLGDHRLVRLVPVLAEGRAVLRIAEEVLDALGDEAVA